jgi:hypothetical protein
MVSVPLCRADRRYVAGFRLLPFKGFTQSHTLELDLGAPYRGGTLRLLWRGYIEYFTATSMYAAHQAGIEPIAPFVEALGGDGQWRRVLDDMGFPAGLPRTTIADLSGRLPRGTTHIRITTNLQIYWDQVLVDRTATAPPVQIHEVPLARARLTFHGYPRAHEGASPGDLTYDYAEVSATGPYARQTGGYTRGGDVYELLRASDDRLAVFGSGDEVALDFDPADLPPPSPGATTSSSRTATKRTWIFTPPISIPSSRCRITRCRLIPRRRATTDATCTIGWSSIHGSSAPPPRAVIGTSIARAARRIDRPLRHSRVAPKAMWPGRPAPGQQRGRVAASTWALSASASFTCT